MIVREAKGNFPFHFWIEKAVAKAEDGLMVVEGVASTGNVDHDNERMSLEAMKSMAEVINTTGVPLRIEHSQKDNAIVGQVNKAWIDERNQLWIKAVLDSAHPAASILYSGLKEGVRMGLSVGGFVKRAVEELVEGVGKDVRTFYDIVLDEVSVTQHPSNYDARLMAKSRRMDTGETNYLEAFAKSIPEGEWQRVEKDYKLDETSMDKKEKAQSETEDETTKKAASDTDETETKKAESQDSEEKTTKKEESGETTKAVSRSEFNELLKMVSQGFNAMTKGMSKMAKAMHVDAMDEAQPSKKKEEPTDQMEAEKSMSDDTDEKATKMDNEPVDQEQPSKKKKNPEEGKNVNKEAAREGQDDDEGNGGTREKAAKETTDDDTYDMETVQRAIKRIQAVSKAMDTEEEKTTKAEDEESTETRKSKVSSMDKFVAVVADTVERMEKGMKENGLNTDHIAKMVVENIRSNPAYQKDIQAMLREPGQKRSVINGTPFVKMRNGRTYTLTALSHPSSKIEKSTDGKKLSFKEAWGSEYSSVRDEEQV